MFESGLYRHLRKGREYSLELSNLDKRLLTYYVETIDFYLEWHNFLIVKKGLKPDSHLQKEDLVPSKLDVQYLIFKVQNNSLLSEEEYDAVMKIVELRHRFIPVIQKLYERFVFY